MTSFRFSPGGSTTNGEEPGCRASRLPASGTFRALHVIIIVNVALVLAFFLSCCGIPTLGERAIPKKPTWNVSLSNFSLENQQPQTPDYDGTLELLLFYRLFTETTSGLASSRYDQIKSAVENDITMFSRLESQNIHPGSFDSDVRLHPESLDTVFSFSLTIPFSNFLEINIDLGESETATAQIDVSADGDTVYHYIGFFACAATYDTGLLKRLNSEIVGHEGSQVHSLGTVSTESGE